jgi:hypothetical protein
MSVPNVLVRRTDSLPVWLNKDKLDGCELGDSSLSSGRHDVLSGW